MASTMRITMAEVQSLMPSIDPRVHPGHHLLAGKNFDWDSKGPRSGFSTLQMSPFPLYNARDVQGVAIQGTSLVFLQDGVYTWRPVEPFTWESLIQFDGEVPQAYRTPWQVVYLSGRVYLSHPFRGFYSYAVPLPGQLPKLRPENSLSIPGLPQQIRNMALVRGRVVMATPTAIYWGPTGAFNSLAPTPGGAGFQLLAQFVKGTTLGLTEFQDGYVVWTTEGAVRAEYIGGQGTWRFSPLESNESPLSPWASVELSSGPAVFLSDHGLFILNQAVPEPWVQDFNEFFREHVKDKIHRGWSYRLDYDPHREVLFLLESSDGEKYQRGWVLRPTLNKWGIFSDPVYGFLALTPERYGYIAADGLAHYFQEQYFREVEPPPELGLDRHYPRVQKASVIPSSSAVSRAVTIDLGAPSTLNEYPKPGWYKRFSDNPVGPYPGPMDSWIEIGYIRPEQLGEAADDLGEIQTVMLGSIPVAATRDDFTTSWRPGYFFGESEDWNSPPIITVDPAPVIEDRMLLPDEIEDQNLVPSYLIDMLLYENRSVSFVDEYTEDWNDESGSEDWGGPVSGLPEITLDLSIRSSQDGRTFEEVFPELARFDTDSQQYATMTSGSFHRVRIAAEQPMQYFHATSIHLSFAYGGQLS